MLEHNRSRHLISAVSDHTIGDRARQLRQRIRVLSDACQRTIFQLPSEIQRLSVNGRTDFNIAGYFADCNGSVLIGFGCDVRSAHRHDSGISILQHCFCGVAAAFQYRLFCHNALIGGYMADLGFPAKHDGKHFVGDLIHAQGIGMGALIPHVLVEKRCFLGNTAFQINDREAEVCCYLMQLRAVFRRLTCIRIAVRIVGIAAGRGRHTVDFRIGVACFHLVEHNRIGFTGSGRRSVGECSVTVLLDQCGIIHIGCLSECILVVGKVVAAEIYENNLGFFPRVVVVKVHRSVAVAHGVFPSSGLEHTRAAPGVVDQQLHAQCVDGLLPPSILQINIVSAFCVINRVVSEGGVGCGAVGHTDIGRCAVAENGNLLALQGFPADSANAVGTLVPRCIHVVVHITISTFAGVSGITLLSTGGGGDNSFVVMIYSCFCIGMTTCRCLPCSKSNKGYLLASNQFNIRNRYAVCRFWRAKCSSSTSATQAKSEVPIIERCNQFPIFIIKTAYCVGFTQEEHILDPYAVTGCHRN